MSPSGRRISSRWKGSAVRGMGIRTPETFEIVQVGKGITDKTGFEKMILPYLALDKLVRHGFQHSDRLRKNVLRSIRKAMN